MAWFAPVGASEARARRTQLTIAAVAILVLVAAVGTDTIKDRFQDRSDASMRGRMIAWKNAVRIIHDFPIAGVGFNAFGTAMLQYQQGDPINFWEEAHNDYLQIVAEGGIIGALVALAAFVVVCVEIRRRFRSESESRSSQWIRFGAVAGLSAIALQEAVEFSLQIPGNAALFAVLLGIALHRSPRLVEGKA
jgi:O-antigen ligase